MQRSRQFWWIGSGFAAVALVAVLAAISMSLAPSALAGDDDDQEECDKHAWLGVMLHGGDDDGAHVMSVVDDSPAEKAGVSEGDRIVAIDGRTIDDVGELVRAIRDQDPNTTVTLTLRAEDGSERSVDATLGERADCFKFAWRGLHFDPEDLAEKLERLPEDLNVIIEKWGEGGEPAGFLGVDVLRTSDSLRVALGGQEGSGVLVNEVTEESAAEIAGLRAGDLITRVDDQDITDPSKLRRVVRAHDPGDVISIELIRERRSMRLDATLGETKGGLRMFHMGSPEGIHVIPEGALDFDFDHEQLNEKIREALESAREQLESQRELHHRERGHARHQLEQARRAFDEARERQREARDAQRTLVRGTQQI
ncbi:MAG: PDZ domain-containing protein [Acidobacteriota bacterium]|nr:MAG: PDZ domain-containing protein [Acidobacteriota bacterium]